MVKKAKYFILGNQGELYFLEKIFLKSKKAEVFGWVSKY